MIKIKCKNMKHKIGTVTEMYNWINTIPTIKIKCHDASVSTKTSTYEAWLAHLLKSAEHTPYNPPYVPTHHNYYNILTKMLWLPILIYIWCLISFTEICTYRAGTYATYPLQNTIYLYRNWGKTVEMITSLFL